MKMPSITEMKKSVLNAGGSFEKTEYTINGKRAYKVNGKLITKEKMVYAFICGHL